MTITVRDTVEIDLPENPTTGYRWEIVSGGDPACELVEDSFVSGGRLVGQGGRHRWQFRGARAGEGTVALAYQRGWERDRPPGRTFTLHVSVKANA